MPVTLISAVFAALVLIAAVVDFMRQRIPNWLSLAVALLFVVPVALHFREVSWFNQLGAAVACLAVGMGLFALKQMGAGDVKLLAAIALWAGLFRLMPLVFFISLAGLLLAGLLVGLRRILAWRGYAADALPISLRPGAGVPFGVAIALGTLVTMQVFPSWVWAI